MKLQKYSVIWSYSGQFREKFHTFFAALVYTSLNDTKMSLVVAHDLGHPKTRNPLLFSGDFHPLVMAFRAGTIPFKIGDYSKENVPNCTIEQLFPVERTYSGKIDEFLDWDFWPVPYEYKPSDLLESNSNINQRNFTVVPSRISYEKPVVTEPEKPKRHPWVIIYK